MARQLLNLDLVVRWLKFAGKTPMPIDLRRGIGMYLSRSIKRKMGNGTKPISGLTQQNRPGNKGGPLHDTGKLMQSIQWELDPRGVEVGSNLIYAPIHQEGGWIRPKNAQKLAIPANKTAALWSSALGVRGALDAMKRNWGPVSFGPGAIFCGGEVQFWRLDEVRIPARPYLYIDKARQKHIDEMVANFYQDMRY